MKRILLSLMLVLFASMTLWAYETTLRSETFTCTTDWQGYVTLEKDLFSGAVAGDKIYVYVTELCHPR